MGMPISSYTVLTALAYGGEEYEIETARRALSPFKLFAFVIHDPQMHSKFHRVLCRTFDRLDYVTGNKLLFFALVDPPPAWLEHAKHRDYYQHFWELYT